jgi:glyoxylase-like metal-dependent hydrolase (beta-lactamase superfamily II)
VVIWSAVFVAAAAILAIAAWFWWRYLRIKPIEIADGVYAVLGAGGNSLVVCGDRQILVVDPKFGLGARALSSWVNRSLKGRVTTVINTHYHYDHTQGNELFLGAQVLAHPRARQYMLSERNDFNDPTWWNHRMNALPSPVGSTQGETIDFPARRVVVTDPGIAHTHGDLWVHLPEVNLVATGDLCFNGFYPFFNGSPAGCSIPGMIHALRELAARYPDATFLPGHGPLAAAADLIGYADYLERLRSEVEAALAANLPENDAVRQTNVAQPGYTWLPSLLGTHLLIATARNNVRWAYRILAATSS